MKEIMRELGERIAAQQLALGNQGQCIDKAKGCFHEKREDIAFVEGLKNETVERRLDGNMVIEGNLKRMGIR